MKSSATRGWRWWWRDGRGGRRRWSWWWRRRRTRWTWRRRWWWRTRRTRRWLWRRRRPRSLIQIESSAERVGANLRALFFGVTFASVEIYAAPICCCASALRIEGFGFFDFSVLVLKAHKASFRAVLASPAHQHRVSLPPAPIPLLRRTERAGAAKIPGSNHGTARRKYRKFRFVARSREFPVCRGAGQRTKNQPSADAAYDRHQVAQRLRSHLTEAVARDQRETTIAFRLAPRRFVASSGGTAGTR